MDPVVAFSRVCVRSQDINTDNSCGAATDVTKGCFPFSDAHWTSDVVRASNTSSFHLSASLRTSLSHHFFISDFFLFVSFVASTFCTICIRLRCHFSSAVSFHAQAVTLSAKFSKIRLQTTFAHRLDSTQFMRFFLLARPHLSPDGVGFRMHCVRMRRCNSVRQRLISHNESVGCYHRNKIKNHTRNYIQ